MTAEEMPEVAVTSGGESAGEPAKDLSDPSAAPASAADSDQPVAGECDASGHTDAAAAEPVAPNSSRPLKRNSQPQKRDAADLEKQRRARAAAIAAVAHAAPGQRERVMNEAIAAASAADATPDTPAEPQIAKADDSKGEAVVKYNVYEAPEWADPPPDTEGVSLDILKTGTILDTIELPQKSFLTLGRNKEADIIAEHPSTSRLHAVLQFQDCAAYLVDCGSTHGTSLNHKQLTPFLYHRVHVGAQFTLGQSTRSYVFNAPEEWQLPEGPSREQRRRAKLEKAMQAKIAADAARDRAAAEKSMHAAIHGGADPDLVTEGEYGDDTPIDWRSKMTSGTGLTDKQMKVAEAIRSREYKLQKTEEAARKIKVKESAGNDLTSGQAAALLGNEKAVDKIQEELEELEDTMQDSLRDSEAGRQATEVGNDRKQKRKRAQEDTSDSEDEFFDRTKKPAKPSKGDAAVLTVKTICSKLQAQEKEAADLRTQLQALQQESEVAINKVEESTATDVLDSYMTNMEAQDSVDKVRKLQFEIRLTEEQLDQTRQLLDVADPSKDHRKRFL